MYIIYSMVHKKKSYKKFIYVLFYANYLLSITAFKVASITAKMKHIFGKAFMYISTRRCAQIWITLELCICTVPCTQKFTVSGLLRIERDSPFNAVLTCATQSCINVSSFLEPKGHSLISTFWLRIDIYIYIFQLSTAGFQVHIKSNSKRIIS